MIKRVYALAILAFKEGIREKAIYGIGLAALLFSSISITITDFFMWDLDKISMDFNQGVISFSIPSLDLLCLDNPHGKR